MFLFLGRIKVKKIGSNNNIRLSISPLGSSCAFRSHQVYINFVNDYTKQWYGIARLPSWRGKPASQIKINVAHAIEFQTKDEKSGLLMHEMGHLFGLCHTYYSADCKLIKSTRYDSNWLNSMYVDADYNYRPQSTQMTTADRRALKDLYK